MGSLARKMNSRFLLIALVAVVLCGLTSPPAWANVDLEKRKIQMLELLGLNGADPAVIRTAQQAHTLHSIDVAPGEKDLSVILHLSGPVEYKSYLYKEGNRLVIDLPNTINLSPSSTYSFGANDPIKQVRNSQYRVSPNLISRIVLELEQKEMPLIKSDGANLIISAPFSRGDSPEAALEQVAEPITPVERVIPVPAVLVDTTTPPIDPVFAAQEQLAPVKKMEEPAPASSEPVDASQEEIIISDAKETEAEEADEDIQQDVVESVPVEQLAAAVADAEQEAAPADAEPAVELEAVPGGAEIAEPEALAAAEPSAAAPVETAAPAVAEPTQEAPVSGTEEAEAEALVEGKEQLVEMPIEVAPAEQPEQAVVAALVTPAETDEEAPADEVVMGKDNLVTLTFRDADLAAVLDILARKGDLNILAGKDVKGNVTVRLVDVPFDVALNAVLNVNGYGYIRTDNIIRVVPLAQLGSQVETRTETFTLSYADGKKAKMTLTSLLSQHGKIEIDERTNMLIVTDVPTNIDRIRELIPQMDRRVQQVLIEVLIIDSVLRDTADLGIQWNFIDTNDPSMAFGTLEDGVGANLPFAGTLNSGFQLAVGTLIDDWRLSAVINALVETTDTRILANPKILTVDNETAIIEIISEFPYNDVTQTSSGGQLSNITFKEIGTKLEVKPQITHDEHVILWLEPEQNSIAGETITGVPIVDTRRAETTLIVQNHQTIVLGGLRENRKNKNLSKVPFFGDLPGIKYIFRSVNTSDEDTELLVFLTVHIVESPPLLASDEIKFEELANMPRKTSVSIDLVR